MNFRNHVYSPLQNTALWLGSWLYGKESFDDADYALTELGGENFAHGGRESLVEILGDMRKYCQPLISSGAKQPAITLLLGGSGDPVAIPPDSDAYQPSVAAGGALVIHSLEFKRYRIYVPVPQGKATSWHIFDMNGFAPATPFLMPGEADQMLVEATNKAAQFVENAGYTTDALTNPRLTVGTLSDFYETPGLPSAMPARAEKLIARADRVSAIAETVIDRMSDHRIDPELLGLGRPIRYARMSAVAYALADWARY